MLDIAGGPAHATVWLVDDSALDREAARRALADRYEVTLFAQGSALLERIASTAAPDVVIIDWVMPEVSGLDIVHFLRARPGMGELAILMLTSRVEVTDIVEGLGAGANDYVRKPFAPEELAARVEALVRGKRLRERAERAERGLRDLLAHLPDPAIGVDERGSISYANHEAERVLHRRGVDLGGRAIVDLLPGISLRLADVADDGAPLILPDVSFGEATYAPAVRRLPGDGAVRFIVSLRDVTLQRSAEARRLDFYSIVAHDLRAPLTSMILLLNVTLEVEKAPIAPEIRHTLARLRSRMRELLAMVDDFLGFARLESHGVSIQRAPVDMSALAAEAIEDFRPLAEQGRVALELDPGIEPPIVHGDRRRLRQVLANLIANAIKFTNPGGAVTIRLHADEGSVLTQVEDTGRGIAPEILPALFRRYTRALDIEQEVAGTGLGLMIVKQIIDAHGGTVGVESTQGKGSTFWFRLPASARRG